MDQFLLLTGSVILICILMNRWVEKLAVPSLLVFIALGMCFGENGLLRIPFDDYAAVNVICSVSLIFIMFYGGFGTNLSAARPVAVQSVVLSTLGVACTAGGVAVFARYALGLPWGESFLIGSVISSTDAASVFSIAGHYTGAGLVAKDGKKIVRPVVLTVLCILFVKVIVGF